MPRKIFQILIYIFAAIGFFLTAGYFAVRFGLTNTSGIIDRQQESFLASGKQTAAAIDSTSQNSTWNEGEQWNVLKEAILKDKTTIQKAADDSGIPARLIVSQLVVEQLRFFYTDRESFKKFFEPLKILGSQTQFSWGVMGVKEETAIQIENHLKDKTSTYYLGKNYENILDFSASSADKKQERYARMTDQHNHYFSYLYAALYLKQIETQWKNAGFGISDRPEILGTLYNIGFAGSHPNASPQSGGAEINIGGKRYSFGSLSSEFYNSNELLAEFPR